MENKIEEQKAVIEHKDDSDAKMQQVEGQILFSKAVKFQVAEKLDAAGNPKFSERLVSLVELPENLPQMGSVMLTFSTRGGELQVLVLPREAAAILHDLLEDYLGII